jgi:hypothetical protein
VSLFFSALLLFLGACAPSAYLKTSGVTPDEITGTYTLILYGGRYAADIENLAILDREDDPYAFEPYAPAFDFKVIKGMPAGDALERAERFVRSHHSSIRSRLSRVLDDTGTTIGYEVRPLYAPLDFGYGDVLDVRYRIEGNKVIVTITLIPEVKRALDQEEMPFLFRMRR